MKDTNVFARALEEVLFGKDLRRICRETAKFNFSLKVQVGKYKELFLELTKKKKHIKKEKNLKGLHEVLDSIELIAPYLCESMFYLESINFIERKRVLCGTDYDKKIITKVLQKIDFSVYGEHSGILWGIGWHGKEVIKYLGKYKARAVLKIKGFMDFVFWIVWRGNS